MYMIQWDQIKQYDKQTYLVQCAESKLTSKKQILMLCYSTFEQCQNELKKKEMKTALNVARSKKWSF